MLRRKWGGVTARWFLAALAIFGLHASARATAPVDSAAVYDLQSVPAGRELLQRYLDSPTWETAGSGADLSPW